MENTKAKPQLMLRPCTCGHACGKVILVKRRPEIIEAKTGELVYAFWMRVDSAQSLVNTLRVLCAEQGVVIE